MDKQQAELMKMKQELLQLTSMPGFRRIQTFAETVVRDLEKKALSEEDDNKANGLRRDARGARAFKEDLFRRIEIAKSISDEPQSDDFLVIAMD